MIVAKRIATRSQGFCDIIDITRQVMQQVAETGIKSGTVTLFIPGSTAGITTIEYEPGLVADLKQMWQRLVPDNIPYAHDRRWGDGNGFSHVRAALLGASLTVPIVNGSLTLGTWQQIVVLDFDNRPRSREIVVQIMGE